MAVLVYIDCPTRMAQTWAKGCQKQTALPLKLRFGEIKSLITSLIYVSSISHRYRNDPTGVLNNRGLYILVQLPYPVCYAPRNLPIWLPMVVTLYFAFGALYWGGGGSHVTC